MKPRVFHKSILWVLSVLTLGVALQAERGEASPLISLAYGAVSVSWQEIIPFQPPEQWLTPRQEDDEWYKNRQQRKYRNRG